eukprot:COSAG01_NODE_3015_length_6719_cov_129.305996_2_plen_39_part_00
MGETPRVEKAKGRREAPECSDFGAGWEDTAKTYGGVRC